MASKDQIRDKKIVCFLTDEESLSTVRSIPFGDYGLTADIQRGDVAFAIQYIKNNGSPDILLVDLSGVTFPVSSIAALAEVCEPSIEVIAMGERNDVGIYRDLVHAGVRDYFAKPVPIPTLINSIAEISGHKKDILEEAILRKTGKLIAVIGASGGIGVSTIVSNSAWSLAEQETKRVCLLDMDLQLGTIPQFMDVPTSSGLRELFESPERIDPVLVDRYMFQYSPNLSILSSQISLYEVLTYNTEVVESILDILAARFHYVMVDLPRNFSNSMNKDIVKKANVIVIMTDYSIASLKNTNYILEMLKTQLTSNQEILLIANKIGQYNAGELTRSQFEENIDRPIFAEIPFDPQYPMQALRDGIPIMEKKLGSVAKGISILVNHLMGVRHNSVQNKGIMSYFFSRNN